MFSKSFQERFVWKFRLVVFILWATFSLGTWTFPVNVLGRELSQVSDVEVQPLLLHVKRLREALAFLGQPLSSDASELLDLAAKSEDSDARNLVQRALDPNCLFEVSINPESRVKVMQGPAPPRLVQNGWSQFLVKVHNQAGVTAGLAVESPNTGKLAGSAKEEIRDLWLDMDMFDSQPLTPGLTGIGLEYRIIQLYSRDDGKRSAIFSFNVGQGSQDIGFRNDVSVTFEGERAVPVRLRILDENGQPATAGFEIRDELGRIYPSQAKRLAPDFAFHPQIYRHDTETVDLPVGEYDVTITRGPEYLEQNKTLVVDDDVSSFQVHLQRWTDPAKYGWWSGDHHIHAAGCSHYDNPSQGVHAPDMLRHCLGEDLKVGANLTWGPCFDYQKQFFTGAVDQVSRYPYLLRYDVEVSGFGSHKSGHLCLLRLKKQIPPGGDSTHHWPTLCLNTLRWAKKQGAVCGPAHSGWGIIVQGTDLPNYEVPAFDSIGANEYIADVTHTVEGPNGDQVPAVDFLSMVDTPYTAELNIWYHTLNCGYRTRVSGETDFPCIYGERVGMGRVYVNLTGTLDYDRWCEGIRNGAAYVSDGRSHLMDLTVGDAVLGRQSELRLDEPQTVKVTVNVAAYLKENPEPGMRNLKPDEKPYWHIERARLSGADLEDAKQQITRAEDALVRRVANDLKNRQTETEQNILRDYAAPTFGPWSFLGPLEIWQSGDTNAERVRTAQKQSLGLEFTSVKPGPIENLTWEDQNWQNGEVHEMALGEFAFGYLYRSIQAERPIELDLDFGVDDAIRAWVNGEEVADTLTQSPAKPGEAQARVQLTAGTNHLLMKVANGKGKAEFYFDASVHGLSDEVRAILNKPIAERTPDETRRFFLDYGMRTSKYEKLVRRIDELSDTISRSVNVELVVNGYPVDTKRIEADGTMQKVSFETKIQRSSWVTVRILPSSHTNPIFVLVGDQPIRASRRSARWCLEGVNKCYLQKEQFIEEDEIEDFHKTYEHAQAAYEKILAECEIE